MDSAVHAPGHGNNVVDGLNETEKRSLKKIMEFIGKLESNNTKKNGILLSASK